MQLLAGAGAEEVCRIAADQFAGNAGRACGQCRIGIKAALRVREASDQIRGVLDQRAELPLLLLQRGLQVQAGGDVARDSDEVRRLTFAYRHLGHRQLEMAPADLGIDGDDLVEREPGLVGLSKGGLRDSGAVGRQHLVERAAQHVFARGGEKLGVLGPGVEVAAFGTSLEQEVRERADDALHERERALQLLLDGLASRDVARAANRRAVVHRGASNFQPVPLATPVGVCVLGKSIRTGKGQGAAVARPGGQWRAILEPVAERLVAQHQPA